MANGAKIGIYNFFAFLDFLVANFQGNNYIFCCVRCRWLFVHK